MNSSKKIILIGALLTILNPIYGADNVPYEQVVEQGFFHKNTMYDLALWPTLGAASIIVPHIIFNLESYYKNISDKLKKLKDKFNDNKNPKLKNYAKTAVVGTLGAASAILVYKNLNNIREFSDNNRENISQTIKQIHATFSPEIKSYSKLATVGTVGAATAILAYKNLNKITQIQFIKK